MYIIRGKTAVKPQTKTRPHVWSSSYIRTLMCQQNKTNQLVRKIRMDSTRLCGSSAVAGRHRLPIRPIVRVRGVDVKKLAEFITDEPVIKPVIKATDLRALFGDDEPPKRLKHWKKGNYKIDQREIIPLRHEEMLEHRVVEVPGENLIVELPLARLGVVCHRIEHQGFEYLLYLDGDTGSLKFFEKRFL